MNDMDLILLTPKKMMTVDEGRQMLELLCNIYPDLAPQLYGNYEPLRTHFDPSDIESALASWKNEFLWKRRSPKSEGSVWTAWGPVPLHGLITLQIEMKKLKIGQYIDFLKQSSVKLEADFTVAHLISDNDLLIGRRTDTIFCGDPSKLHYLLTITTHTLKMYIPDLYWITIFGPAYIRHFGREKLLASPVPIVEELPGGNIYLQLCDDPEDFATNYAQVGKVRQAVKQHLGVNSFYSPDQPDGHVYDVPDFNLPPCDPDKIW